MPKYNCREPKWNSNNTFDVIWNHPDLGDMPFTVVNPSSGEYPGEPDYMQEIWDEGMAGEYGEIAPYQP